MNRLYRFVLLALAISVVALFCPCAAHAAVSISTLLTGEAYCDCGDSRNLAMPADINSKSLKSTARNIVRSVRTPDMDDYELALALNDWLMENTSYKSHTTGAMNVLANGYASCSGYANAYCALLNAADIPYKRVVGKVFRFTHVWNLVKLGGNWYHVDVRLNDSSQSHLYFGLSNEAISVNHSAFGKRDCVSYEYNYGYRSGMYDEAIAYIESQIEENFSKNIPAFAINLRDSNCPEPLTNEIMARSIAGVLSNRRYAFDGEEHRIRVLFVDGGIAINVDIPFVRITSITLDKHNVKLSMPDSSSFPITYQLSASITPSNASNPVLFWKSRNEKVASVDQNGLVTIKRYGNAKIQALSEDYSKKIDTCKFTVRKK
ncbi:MAG: Ig-like domain-containing protein [Clostridia bacterium]|nr:Ig-like domain-containing protein [Clostridia bacterium]